MYGESCFDFQQKQSICLLSKTSRLVLALMHLVFNSKIVLFYPVESGLGLRVTTPRNVHSSSIIRRPALPLLHTYNDVHNYATFTFNCKWFNQFTRRCRENIRLTIHLISLLGSVGKILGLQYRETKSPYSHISNNVWNVSIILTLYG